MVNTYPHDASAFTQGLVFANDLLYESTGRYGQSTLREVHPETGKVIRMLKLPNELFGEGLAALEDQLVQLTWRAQVGFVFERTSFRLARAFKYPGEGWGLTFDGKHLIMSDGSATLRYINPSDFSESHRVPVQDDRGPVDNLNELEYVGGEIYANVWKTDRIARINPQTGHVIAWIDLSGLRLLAGPSQTVDVLNGIAYDPARERLFVTGKLWPALFEIRVTQP